MIRTFFLTFWSFQIISVFCGFGEMVTDQFEIFDDELAQCNWYSLPIKLQRQYGIFMSGAQQTTYIRGFGNIECTRESLKQVLESLQNI